MKNLKFGVLAFAVIGLVGILMSNVAEGLKHDTASTIIVLAGFAIPAALAGMGIQKGFKRPQAIISLVGFALVVIKLRVWQTIKFLSLMPMGLKMAIIGAAAGAIVALVAVIKSEE